MIKLNVEDINFKTNLLKSWEKEILYYNAVITEDLSRDNRLSKQLCKRCFCESYMAGQAFTKYNCRMCNKEGNHPNTGVPALCIECAKEYELCIQCGAQIDGKQKRKL